MLIVQPFLDPSASSSPKMLIPYVKKINLLDCCLTLECVCACVHMSTCACSNQAIGKPDAGVRAGAGRPRQGHKGRGQSRIGILPNHALGARQTYRLGQPDCVFLFSTEGQLGSRIQRLEVRSACEQAGQRHFIGPGPSCLYLCATLIKITRNHGPPGTCGDSRLDPALPLFRTRALESSRLKSNPSSESKCMSPGQLLPLFTLWFPSPQKWKGRGAHLTGLHKATLSMLLGSAQQRQTHEEHSKRNY